MKSKSKSKSKFTFVTIFMFLVGCATVQPPIPLTGNTMAPQTTGRVGVVMTALPKVAVYLPGANCLLCIAAASAANSSLKKHAETLSSEELSTLKGKMADLIRKKGINVTVVTEDINFDALSEFGSSGPNVAKYDFTPLKQKYGVDKLVVINITRVGYLRTYSAYFPTSDPKAFLEGTVSLVNLNNNTYEWYLPVNVTRSADGNWDEPPKFPGLTNAYFQALELGKDSYLKPLSQ